jgi:NAD+ synthase
MQHDKITQHIVGWLQDYLKSSGQIGFVVGVSGGIDSALTSTLCAMTGAPTLCLELPIHQPANQVSRALHHIESLQSRFSNVTGLTVPLSDSFDGLVKHWQQSENAHLQHLALANTRARLRMTTLYYYAGIHRSLVAGTGNKVEDFGVGFYTKYGDGGVDISPIADLTKTQVRVLAAHLGVQHDILVAPPTDGLWQDDRSDEDQIGATYPELEWAMDWLSNNGLKNDNKWIKPEYFLWNALLQRQQEVLTIYMRLHNNNQHKMIPIPVCEIPQDWL